MKKVYLSAFTLMCLPSLFGQKFNNVYDFGSEATVMKAINAADNAVQIGMTNKKGASPKAFNVLWSENFGTASSSADSADILTTSNGDWVQNLDSKDSTFWSLRSVHPLSYDNWTDALDGRYLSWDSYTPMSPYEDSFTNQDAITSISGSIVSPKINLSNVSGGVMLNFKSQGFFCCSGTDIPFKICISEDNGVNWSDTLTVDFGVTRNQNSDQIARPAEFTFDISNYTSGHSADTKLKFIWDGTSLSPSQQYNTYYFWLIDDIQVYEKPQYDFELENLWLCDIRNRNEYEYTSIPKDFAGKLTVQAKIHKLGTSKPSDLKLKVTVSRITNNVSTVIDVVEGGTFSNNLSKDYDTVTFVTPIDLSAYSVSQYQVKAELIFTGDNGDPSNDNLTRTMNVTNFVYGHRDYEQLTYFGSVGRGLPGLVSTTNVSQEMTFGNVYYIPKDVKLQGINLFIGNQAHYQTKTGELTVDLYTFDPSVFTGSLASFQDAHKDVTPAGSWSFDITDTMICEFTPPNGCFRANTLNFNKTAQGPPTLLGGKYYIAAITHAGGNNNHFCYADQPRDYDLSTHVNLNGVWNVNRQIIADLTFDESLSTNTIEKDVNVGFIAPNPTSGETTVGFSIKSAQDVVIEVVDLTGKTLISKVEKGLAAGSHFSSFDAGILSSGVYCVNIKTESAISTQKFIKK